MVDRRISSRFVAVMALVVASVGLAAGPTQAKTDGDRGASAEHNPHTDHCYTPDGIDLNELYGTSDQIVSRFCPEAEAGERWTSGAPWLMNKSFEHVPEGFEPAGDTPTEDFVAKFVSAKFVVDPGTPAEKTYVFPKSERLWTGEWPAGEFKGYPTVNTTPMTSLKPLSVGEHSFELYLTMSGVHCDGLGVVVEENCLPDGEFSWGGRPFKVIPQS